ncbi:beta-hexosaminidase subunit alpha-like isoform X2 [Eriocheir sinensis]|uniref:beta-hexosaminidase subunit alpha-like isoform X2 n=1 Tax=Eriocheir sinensis TaxID=95602 RepID=UPI0021CA4E20|nr:beta-hexosaminidase subunit alpha-like isoform X2 [Eriocheir sinensis]
MRAVYVLSVVAAAGWLGRAWAGFPMVTPTVGDVWPRPQTAQYEDTYMTVTADNFAFVVVGHSCDIVEEAVTRYTDIIFQSAASQMDRQTKSYSLGSRAYLDQLSVNLSAPCEDYPYQGMDESYELKVDSPDYPGSATLSSQSVWGILRGLETFSQLLLPDASGFRAIRATHITDFPRFSYRGLMLDTSRHFLPPAKIHETLDLMAMNKFNVFHWHVVDDQSFPFVSVAFPDISRLGAYTERHVYTLADVAGVVEYARLRGIRVLPEFDTPGHTRSWGPGQPSLLTQCYQDSVPDGTFGPIDPSNEKNFDFLTEFFAEVTSRFPDRYVHLGADEVDYGCWQSNPAVSDFMDELGISGQYDMLEEYYITRLFGIIAGLPTTNSYLVWQDVFDKGMSLAEDTVVQVWQDGDSPADFMDKVDQVTMQGYFAILSSCWYLNLDTFGSDWFDYYTCDPHDFPGWDDQKALVLGGEACVWTEYEDRTNLIPRTWPRAALVAEKLWSSVEDTASVEGVPERLDEHRCRLLARGYDVEPLLPSYCTADIV